MTIGCQDIIRLFQLHSSETSYDGAILQAPVSDREFATFYTAEEDIAKTIEGAEEQVKAGGGSYPLHWELLKIITDYKDYKDPISAERWLSLISKKGKEDFFSSDLTDEELYDIFRGPRLSGKPIHFLLGEKDECYPQSIDIQNLLDRFMHAMRDSKGPASGQVLAKATHSIEDEKVQQEFISIILDFIKNLP